MSCGGTRSGIATFPETTPPPVGGQYCCFAQSRPFLVSVVFITPPTPYAQPKRPIRATVEAGTKPLTLEARSPMVALGSL